jgi:hypothetical protein
MAGASLQTLAVQRRCPLWVTADIEIGEPNVRFVPEGDIL